MGKNSKCWITIRLARIFSCLPAEPALDFSAGQGVARRLHRGCKAPCFPSLARLAFPPRLFFFSFSRPRAALGGCSSSNSFLNSGQVFRCIYYFRVLYSALCSPCNLSNTDSPSRASGCFPDSPPTFTPTHSGNGSDGHQVHSLMNGLVLCQHLQGQCIQGPFHGTICLERHRLDKTGTTCASCWEGKTPEMEFLVFVQSSSFSIFCKVTMTDIFRLLMQVFFLWINIPISLAIIWV